MAYYLYKTCETCGGDGTVDSTYPPGSSECWRCGGIGKVQTHEVNADLADLLDTVFDKVKTTDKNVKDMTKVVDAIWDKLNE